MPTISETKFTKIREIILAKRTALDDTRSELERRYGSGCHTVHYSRGDLARLVKAQAAYDRAADRMFALLHASPRDWCRGVPMHWICEELSYADAVAPVGVALTVEPPRAYGY